jgi:hypothetical protein
MYVIHQKRDGLASRFVHFLTLQLPFLHEFMIKIDEQKGLILDIREEIMLSNKFKDVWSPEAYEVWQCFARLAVGGVPGAIVRLKSSWDDQNTNSSARHSMRMASEPTSLFGLGEDLSRTARIATMTAPMS